MDCIIDTDFAGRWGVKDQQEPLPAKSRTGYVLCLAKCPIIWTRKIQSDIASSIMEAEYKALSMAMKDLLRLK
jgi:hypothetical protein